MPNYEVSFKAEEDIDRFRRYLIRENGLKVSEEFVNSIYELFDFIAQYPNVAKSKKDIDDGAFSYPHVKYKRVVLFKHTDDGITIVRVLGGRQDQSRHVSDDDFV